MMATFNECVEKTKEILATDLEEELINNAAKAIQGHQTVFDPVRTGYLLGNIKVKRTPNGVECSFPHYAQYLEFGTGLYGPKKKRIYPTKKQALAWGKDLGEGKKQYVFKSIKGMRPAPFIRPTFHQRFTELLVNALNEGFKNYEIK